MRLINTDVTSFMMKKVLLILFLFCANNALAAESISSGKLWFDNQGNRINAHGGGILYFNNTYYWYGEYKGNDTYRSPGVGWECYRTDAMGVSCYSSKDLINWKFEGIVLDADTANALSDLHPTMVIERPKVIYNEKTKKFVMWMHIDNHRYDKACAGVAVSDSPTGKFTFINAMRPNGQESRDMTLFKDDNGKAYLISSSESNGTMHINLLSDDYLSLTGQFTRNFIGKSREAPAMFKRGRKYYIISSGCTGWDPNEADYALAESPMGPFTMLGNPCRGKDADKTFYGQSTFVFTIANQPDKYIIMFDKWNKRDLINSSYIWLPIQFMGDSIIITWKDNWNIEDLQRSECITSK